MADQFLLNPFVQPNEQRDMEGIYHASIRHSFRIKAIRYVLPASIPLIFIVVAILMGRSLLSDPLVVTVEPEEPGGVRMIRPVFSGSTKDGISYRLEAKSAKRDEQNPAQVTLEEPMLETKDGISASAGRGEFNSDTSILILTDNVKVDHANGYTVSSAYLQIDINAKVGNGNKEIVGRGPMGSIKADYFTIDEASRTIRFDGNTRTILNPSYSSLVSSNQE